MRRCLMLHFIAEFNLLDYYLRYLDYSPTPEKMDLPFTSDGGKEPVLGLHFGSK